MDNKDKGMKQLALISILSLSTYSCSEHNNETSATDNTQLIDSKCKTDITDTIGRDIYRIVTNDSCEIVFRSEFTFSNKSTQEYYYDATNRLVLSVKKTDSNILNIIPNETRKNNFEYSFEAGRLIYLEYLSPIYGINDHATEGDLCRILLESTENFDNEVNGFLKKYYGFSFSANELENLKFYVNEICFNSPL